MADIIFIISALSNSDADAANSTTLTSSSFISFNSDTDAVNSATLISSSSVSSTFIFFMAYLFPPHEGFNNDSISIYHQNENDDADTDDDDDDAAVDDVVDEDEAINHQESSSACQSNC
ncbi:predicted protein [Histoplasma capsulatum G186AR]|uniref:Uncharacterized protein n=1 Tax=Ajellomyces capsulatus (strain G186AR / H82 / ATCC MYA-2454 / RMSCC 2432) TaxID=447093 RepID=C0P1A6_AJECG|nr:uncharacterized protein HCBG_09186 [Histoplasma capsulatum G186AR]EEH02573.1 predicted protein [Histoplasma capsulatum G186AR]